MLRRIATSVLAAGVLAGLVISLVQHITTTPLILEAEKFEASVTPSNDWAFDVVRTLVHAGETHDEDGNTVWGPDGGFERILFTTLTNILLGVGFAAILVAGFVMRGRAVDGRIGAMWGMAGFACISLAPALGLPPELPGMIAGDLVERQGWWLMCALATAAGLATMTFSTAWVWRIAGIVLIVTPHAIGAPHLHVEEVGLVPAELAAQFAAASLVTAAVFWSVVGWLAGTVYQRMEPSA